MINITFFNKAPDNMPMVFVVICAQYNGKWIFVRHKERNTYEIPGGHIEPNEDSVAAAKRELYEETGATDFTLDFVSVYAVEKDEQATGGYLFFADVKTLSDLPEYEIASVNFFDRLPDNLTYPSIQPFLSERVRNWMKTRL